ncbi:L domain-like protein [Rhodofomes roseus]|uniref:L domain-like protein n=1 Tax=Rhodofomes roseus TaxID=34475 RepID=A0ABQ8KJV2_9APHY|nr:L domain-like protein [Rhodofomes roseus]KAH9838427.1 L domain-like protein [Rhodofomes roseus]
MTDLNAVTEEKVAVEGIATQATVKAPPEKNARIATVTLPTAEDGHTSGEDEGVEEQADVDDSEILEDLPDDTEEIELIHSRLNSISRLGLQRFGRHLRKLCLRQNYISQLDPEVIQTLVELEELDMYDNKIKSVDDSLSALKKLSVLDLSFNLLRDVPESIQYLASLEKVFFVQNKISHISGLDRIGQTLRSLELGGNRLRKIENLDSLFALEELWLGKNKIATLEGLAGLKNLRILSIQSNRITKLEGLEGLENLEEFYISHNGILRLEGLEKNTKLRTLDIGNNFVEALENVSHLSNLEELWMNDNKVDSLDALEPQLKHISTLETIYLEGNPVQKKEGTSYRRKVILALPQVKQLDATYVKQF